MVAPKVISSMPLLSL